MKETEGGIDSKQHRDLCVALATAAATTTATAGTTTTTTCLFPRSRFFDLLLRDLTANYFSLSLFSKMLCSDYFFSLSIYISAMLAINC